MEVHHNRFSADRQTDRQTDLALAIDDDTAQQAIRFELANYGPRYGPETDDSNTSDFHSSSVDIEKVRGDKKREKNQVCHNRSSVRGTHGRTGRTDACFHSIEGLHADRLINGQGGANR